LESCDHSTLTPQEASTVGAAVHERNAGICIQSWGLCEHSALSVADASHAALQAILARDPFANPNYVLAVNPGSPVSSDGRFDLDAGETFAYEPPPVGGQPNTEQFSFQYQQTSTTGSTTIDTYQNTFSISGSPKLASFVNADKITTITSTNKFALQTTNVTTQTAALKLTGPCVGYNSPTDVQAYQNNVYGTFMFSFVNHPQTTDFSLCVTSKPNPLTVNTGTSGTYTVFSSPSNGFTGNISLSATGLPAGFTVLKISSRRC